MGGSLGGVQVVSLCEGAGVHSCVASAGRLPQPHAHAHAHAFAPPHPDEKALFFTISRKVLPASDDDAPGKYCQLFVYIVDIYLWYRLKLTSSTKLLTSQISNFVRYLLSFLSVC